MESGSTSPCSPSLQVSLTRKGATFSQESQCLIWGSPSSVSDSRNPMLIYRALHYKLCMGNYSLQFSKCENTAMLKKTSHCRQSSHECIRLYRLNRASNRFRVGRDLLRISEIKSTITSKSLFRSYEQFFTIKFTQNLQCENPLAEGYYFTEVTLWLHKFPNVIVHRDRKDTF